MAGAPKGNRNGAKGNEFRKALDYVLRNYEDDEVKRGKALRRVAMKLVKTALNGNESASMTAIQEIANRLDGKPTQTIQGNGISLNFNILPYEDGQMPKLVMGERVVDTLTSDQPTSSGDD